MDKNIKERRFGKFAISWDMIEDHLSSVKEFLSQMVVIEAETRYLDKRIEYKAIYELFKPVPSNEEIPRYNLYYFIEPIDKFSLGEIHIFFDFEV